MQQDHAAISHAENHPRDPVAAKVAADFPQPFVQRRTVGAAQRPAELDLLDILADRVPVSIGKTEDPFTNGTDACGRHIKAGWQLFRAVDH